MDARARILASRLCAVLVGCGLAFFFVFAPLFTDGPRSLLDGERLASLALLVGVYLACAVILGFLDPGDGALALVLAAPGVLIAAWYGLRETGTLGLAALEAALCLAASYGGVRLAALKPRRSG